MKKLLFILFFIISFSGLSQNFADKYYYLVDSLELDKISESDKKLIDSCLTFYHQEKDDTLMLKSISTIVEESWDDKVWPKYNMWLFNFIQQKLKENPNKEVKNHLRIKLAGAMNNIGYHYNIKGDINNALIFYERGLKIQQELKAKKGMATSFNNIGALYKKQGDISTALEYYLKSLEIHEEINNPTGVGQALNNIGNIYQEQGDPNLALEYFHKGHKLYQETGDKRSIATVLNNLGFTYFKKNNLPKALAYYNQSIEIRKTLNDSKGIANCYNNIASAYEYQDKNDTAMEYYLKSNKIYHKLGYRLGISTSSVNIGRILFHQGKLKESKQYTLLGLEMAEKAGSPKNIQGAAKLLSDVYKKEGDGLKALKMHKLYIVMRDSVNNIKNQKALIQQNAKYQYQKEKAIDDAERDNLIAIEQKEKEKQTIISIGVATGLLFVILFLFFVFNRLKVARKQKVLIEIQNKEIVDSITYAKRIQEAILPSRELFNKIFPENFIYYKPKDIVAGDFYWLEPFDLSKKNKEDLVLFAVADCTGHGVPGAMVSVVCNNALNAAVREHKLTDPGKILDKTREIVAQQFTKSQTISISNIRDGMDIALCVLNTKTKTIEFAGAHNSLWILRNETNEIEELKATRQAIGKIDKPKPFLTKTTQLYSGDQIYLFSDGFVDQFGGEKGKKMMNKRFKELLIANKTQTLENQKNSLNSYFEKWKGNLEQVDDVCIMGIRV